MTSLGKLVFVDTHSRQSKLSLSNTSSQNLNKSLSLAFENLFYMPYDIIETYGNTVLTLDISHNKFSRNLHFLAEFENLTSLNLDYNDIDDFTTFLYMPKLQLLWLNYNNIKNLYPFLKNLYTSLPNLRYLCLMGNKAAPSYFNGGTFYDYLQYRLFVISWFPRLVHLDDRVITAEQLTEAKRLFKRPIFDQLVEKTPLPNCLKLLHNKLTAMFFKPLVLSEQFKSTKTVNLII
ncbi:PREDICTED: leucine-rich repeat-containing protein C10orf11-like [Ceratosolen solmsi marchali]|uniref:Leucine-rich repeat-containing protein C10orf11-like n=1 Tax=Ceratosolen solmsi marchali TaxID=326594 RepID=A0AAJ6YMM1_9HYME|nr:PREDICTED: leucine-rich repeat-containing protein C10orf11-like [Ceratosolen solmsi marchali]XP_011500844.1 PREDICTED: leucine-rich repeat-containing protein C10orf11-like [Ceratosolen solmsi marchali]